MTAFRAVLDTNVVLAAHRSTHPASPNREVIERWRGGEFTLLYSDDVTLEYGEKMIEHGIARADVLGWMGLVQLLGERVKIETFHLRRYPADVDDIGILLCAINGHATHLVSYDGDFEPFTGDFAFAICQSLAFLRELRANL